MLSINNCKSLTRIYILKITSGSILLSVAIFDPSPESKDSIPTKQALQNFQSSIEKVKSSDSQNPFQFKLIGFKQTSTGSQFVVVVEDEVIFFV